MSKKDYELLAAAIKSSRDRVGAAAVDIIAMMIASALANDNERFDRDKFLAACGVLPFSIRRNGN